MALTISKAEVWAGDIQDRAGGLAEVLDPLANAGASLECVIARRQPEKSGTGVVFVTPVKGKKVQQAARGAGLGPIAHPTLRVEGADKPGLGSQITRAIADAGINVRGLSAVVIGRKFVAYVSFDRDEDARRATQALKSVGAARRTAR